MGKKKKSKKRRGAAAHASPPAPRSHRWSTVAPWLARNGDYLAAAATALAFVAHLFTTSDYFLGSGTDLVSHEHPLHSFATSWLARGVLPLWNPFIFGGVPFQAGVHGYLYPGWWTGVVLPVGFDIKLGILIHLVLTALGGVYMARSRTRSRLASCAAGIILSVGAFPVMHLYAGHRVMVATAAYLPWLVGALDRVDRGDRRAPFVGLGAAGLMMLAGHYQIIFYGLGSLLAFRLLEALVGERPGTLEGRARPRLALRAGVSWLVLLAGGAAIAAVQLLPMFSVVDLSQRSGGDATFAASFSSAPANLLTYVVPDLFGNKIHVPFVGAWSYWESLGYVGLVPLALIVLAPAVLPWRRWLPAVAVACGALLLTLGAHTPLFDLYLAVVPGADLFRSAGRFSVVVALFAALVAAAVIDALLSPEGPSPRRLLASRVLVWLLPAATAVAAIVLVGAEADGFRAWLEEVGSPKRLGRLSDADLGGLLALARENCLKATLVTIAAALSLTVGLGKPKRASWAGAILVALLVIDLFHFGHRFLRTGPETRFQLPERIVEILREEGGAGTRVIPPAETRWPNFPAMNGLGNPGGYDTFIDSRWARYVNRSQDRALDRFFGIERLRRGGPLVRHLGAEFLLTRKPLEKGRNGTIRNYGWYEPFKRVGDVSIYRDPTPTPRAMLVHRLDIIEDEEEAYRRLESPGFDPRERVIVEEALPAGFPSPEPAPGAPDEGAEIIVLEPNRMELEVRAARDAVLVVSDTLQPGWRAEVDGAEVPMVHANRVMRALPVPTGEHRVVMTYLPGAFVAGAVISLLSLIGLIAGVFLYRRTTTSSPRSHPS